MNHFDADALRKWYRPTHRVLVITGAGVSVDSGLPTYRGVAGLYESKTTEDGFPIEVALSGNMYRRRPEITWKYLMQIAQACQGKSFNRGHELIVELEEYFQEVWVLTQNIDGFHRDAGSRQLIEIHGTMRRLQCPQCQATRPVQSLESESIPPACQACGGAMRPDVVLFGEMLPEKALEEYQVQINKGFDAIFVVGTTAVFPYIASPIHLFSGSECLTVEINPEDTDLSAMVDFKLDCGATQGLAEFISIVKELN